MLEIPPIHPGTGESEGENGSFVEANADHLAALAAAEADFLLLVREIPRTQPGPAETESDPMTSVSLISGNGAQLLASLCEPASLLLAEPTRVIDTLLTDSSRSDEGGPILTTIAFLPVSASQFPGDDAHVWITARACMEGAIASRSEDQSSLIAIDAVPSAVFAHEAAAPAPPTLWLEFAAPPPGQRRVGALLRIMDGGGEVRAEIPFPPISASATKRMRVSSDSLARYADQVLAEEAPSDISHSEAVRWTWGLGESGQLDDERTRGWLTLSWNQVPVDIRKELFEYYFKASGTEKTAYDLYLGSRKAYAMLQKDDRQEDLAPRRLFFSMRRAISQVPDPRRALAWLRESTDWIDALRRSRWDPAEADKALTHLFRAFTWRDDLRDGAPEGFSAWRNEMREDLFPAPVDGRLSWDLLYGWMCLHGDGDTIVEPLEPVVAPWLDGLGADYPADVTPDAAPLLAQIANGGAPPIPRSDPRWQRSDSFRPASTERFRAFRTGALARMAAHPSPAVRHAALFGNLLVNETREEMAATAIAPSLREYLEQTILAAEAVEDPAQKACLLDLGLYATYLLPDPTEQVLAAVDYARTCLDHGLMTANILREGSHPRSYTAKGDLVGYFLNQFPQQNDVKRPGREIYEPLLHSLREIRNRFRAESIALLDRSHPTRRILSQLDGYEQQLRQQMEWFHIPIEPEGGSFPSELLVDASDKDDSIPTGTARDGGIAMALRLGHRRHGLAFNTVSRTSSLLDDPAFPANRVIRAITPTEGGWILAFDPLELHFKPQLASRPSRLLARFSAEEFPDSFVRTVTAGRTDHEVFLHASRNRFSDTILHLTGPPSQPRLEVIASEAGPRQDDNPVNGRADNCLTGQIRFDGKRERLLVAVNLPTGFPDSASGLFAWYPERPQGERWEPVVLLHYPIQWVDRIRENSLLVAFRS
ncbi:MAG: hypothetical protein ACLFRP_08410, partial [Puniceicoccaceae bacterium]